MNKLAMRLNSLSLAGCAILIVPPGSQGTESPKNPDSRLCAQRQGLCLSKDSRQLRAKRAPRGSLAHLGANTGQTKGRVVTAAGLVSVVDRA